MACRSAPSLLGLAQAPRARAGGPVCAQGPIAGKAEALPEFNIGRGESGHMREGGEYSIATGKGYSLKISSTGMRECAFIAPVFLRNIYEGEAEGYFAVIRPGECKRSCRNLETTDLQGTFSVK